MSADRRKPFADGFWQTQLLFRNFYAQFPRRDCADVNDNRFAKLIASPFRQLNGVSREPQQGACIQQDHLFSDGQSSSVSGSIGSYRMNNGLSAGSGFSQSVSRALFCARTSSATGFPLRQIKTVSPF